MAKKKKRKDKEIKLDLDLAGPRRGRYTAVGETEGTVGVTRLDLSEDDFDKLGTARRVKVVITEVQE